MFKFIRQINTIWMLLQVMNKGLAKDTIRLVDTVTRLEKIEKTQEELLCRLKDLLENRPIKEETTQKIAKLIYKTVKETKNALGCGLEVDVPIEITPEWILPEGPTCEDIEKALDDLEDEYDNR